MLLAITKSIQNNIHLYVLIIWCDALQWWQPPTPAVLALHSMQNQIHFLHCATHISQLIITVCAFFVIERTFIVLLLRCRFVLVALIGFGNIWIWSKSVHWWQCTRMNVKTDFLYKLIACTLHSAQCTRLYVPPRLILDCAWIVTTARWCAHGCISFSVRSLLAVLTNTNLVCVFKSAHQSDWIHINANYSLNISSF